NLQSQQTTVNAALLAQAIEDVYNDKDTVMKESEVMAVLTKLQEITQAAIAAEQERLKEINKVAGEAFLAENAEKEGMVVLESGLQYEVLKEGTGIQPAVDDEVTVHYHGTLIDGTVFDSSVDRGEPITFNINRLIEAWKIILPMMKEGAKYRIFSPSDLAYGESAPPTIGPNSTLIFEIELIKVNK
ncbi:MAG: FKBP-type peptidyl-prolyl cis-trans isomerase, partial [Bacteroidota bacterium]